MKTKEELNALKAEYDSLNRKLGELTDDEIEQVTGGMKIVVIKGGSPFMESNSCNVIQEREERLRYGWLDKGIPDPE